MTDEDFKKTLDCIFEFFMLISLPGSEITLSLDDSSEDEHIIKMSNKDTDFTPDEIKTVYNKTSFRGKLNRMPLAEIIARLNFAWVDIECVPPQGTVVTFAIPRFEEAQRRYNQRYPPVMRRALEKISELSQRQLKDKKLEGGREDV